MTALETIELIEKLDEEDEQTVYDYLSTKHQKCFADIGKTKCAALEKKKCETCNFYKTRKQHQNDLKKAQARLRDIRYTKK